MIKTTILKDSTICVKASDPLGYKNNFVIKSFMGKTVDVVFDDGYEECEATGVLYDITSNGITLSVGPYIGTSRPMLTSIAWVQLIAIYCSPNQQGE